MRIGRIYFRGMFGTPDFTDLRGGQQVIRQHVDILREANYDSWIVYSGSRFDRFCVLRRKPPEPFIPEIEFRGSLKPDRDAVVIPGRHVPHIREIPGRNKVLFSQGVGVTMRNLGVSMHDPSPWRDESLRAILCVSESNASILRLMNPRAPVVVVRNSVDPAEFIENSPKGSLILTNTAQAWEKNPFDTCILAQMLHARRLAGYMPDFDLVELKGYSRLEMAGLLGKARLLLFLSTHEGLPLLALEAMLSGVVVLGFRRGPMTEIIPEEGLFEFGDLLGIADAVQSVLQQPESWADVVRKGRETALSFGPSQQRESVLSAWQTIDRALGTASSH